MFARRSLARTGVAALMAACIASGPRAQMIAGFPDSVRTYDPRDLALLPPYCKYTQEFRERVAGGDDKGEIERWQAALGPAFHHLHHYCWGMINANRGLLLARGELARKHFLNDAVHEFDYVIERSAVDFVLLPEVLARRGQALLKLEQPGRGIESIERAIQLKPEYWPAYAYVGDYYRDIGDPKRAREWLLRGLEKSPDAEGLKSRIQALDSDGVRQSGAR